MTTKYAPVSAICAIVGADTEAKQQQVVGLLSSPEFAEGRLPITRNGDVFIEEKTVYEAAHHGPAGFPADQMYEGFPNLVFDALPAEAAPARPARTPRTPRAETPAPAASEEEARIGAALTGLPEAEVGAPEGSAPAAPTVTPDAPAEEKPKPTRRRRTAKPEEEAPAANAAQKATVEATPDAAPQAAVDAAVERTKFAAARITRDDALAALTRQKEMLEIELASILYAIENI